MSTPTTRDPNLICRHYLTILHNSGCEAGVLYADLQVEPNLTLAEAKGICMGRRQGCPKYKPYSAAEIKAMEDFEIMVAVQNNKAREAIVKKSGGKRGVWGDIKCPICISGNLHYQVSPYEQKHIKAKCTTALCINFDEQ